MGPWMARPPERTSLCNRVCPDNTSPAPLKPWAPSIFVWRARRVGDSADRAPGHGCAPSRRGASAGGSAQPPPSALNSRTWSVARRRRRRLGPDQRNGRPAPLYRRFGPGDEVRRQVTTTQRDTLALPPYRPDCRERSGGMNSGSSCRSPTARSTRWKNEATSLAASISHRDASFGTWRRSRHGCRSAAKPISKAERRSRPGRMFANARPAPSNRQPIERHTQPRHRRHGSGDYL